MIRPSALTLAEKCGLSAKLAADFPEASPAADRGTAIHAEIAAALAPGGPEPKSPEAIAAVEWLRRTYPGLLPHPEYAVQLDDVETGEPITAGTADLVLVDEP